MNFRILKNKNFSLLIFGELVSLFGTQFQDLALSLYILKITGSATKFASILAVAYIPQIILGPAAGVFVDWFDRKKTIIYLNLLNGVVILLLSIAFLTTGQLKLGYIYAAVLVMSINQIMFSPAVGTVIPSIMKESELVSANSVNAFIQAGAGLLAPLLAGAVYGNFGLSPILIFNSISFVFASFCEFFITIPDNDRHIVKFDYHQFLNDFSDGLKFIRLQKLLLGIALCGFVINFAIGPTFSIGLPYIVKKALNGTDSQYGLLCSITAVGNVIGPVLAGIIGKKNDAVHIFVYGILAMTGFTCFMAFVICPVFTGLFSTNWIPLIVMSLIVILIIATAMVVNINLSVLKQKIVPNKMMGRVGAALSTVFTAAIPLGQIIFGMLFDNITSYLVMLICAGILAVTFLISGNLIKYSKKDFVTNGQKCVGGEL